MSSPQSDRVPSLRAALLAVVVFVHGVAASPLPPSPTTPKAMANPIAVEELNGWVTLLGELGVKTTRAELTDLAIESSTVTSELRTAVIKPFRPLLRITGTGQGWGLFTYPNTHPHRLVIEVERDGKFEVVYRALDPDHTYLEPQLTFRRVRGVYDDNASKVRPSYESFARWVARHAFEDWPDATRVRVKMIRTHVVTPGQAADPIAETRLVRVVKRGEEGP
jgi:hypothetical protein